MQGLFTKRKANVLKSLVLQRNVKGEGLLLYLSDTHDYSRGLYGREQKWQTSLVAWSS